MTHEAVALVEANARLLIDQAREDPSCRRRASRAALALVVGVASPTIPILQGKRCAATDRGPDPPVRRHAGLGGRHHRLSRGSASVRTSCAPPPRCAGRPGGGQGGRRRRRWSGHAPLGGRCLCTD
ncbi:hypothetical protein ACRAWD_11510 [Caulobacter segnis]